MPAVVAVFGLKTDRRRLPAQRLVVIEEKTRNGI
jgi:hypothetical protein